MTETENFRNIREIMEDKELFLELLKNKDKYIVSIDNDNVSFTTKENYKKYNENIDEEWKEYSFNNFGYELLNEVFQALGIDSELV